MQSAEGKLVLCWRWRQPCPLGCGPRSGRLSPPCGRKRKRNARSQRVGGPNGLFHPADGRKQPRIDLSRPIPIDRLASEFDRIAGRANAERWRWPSLRWRLALRSVAAARRLVAAGLSLAAAGLRSAEVGLRAVATGTGETPAVVRRAESRLRTANGSPKSSRWCRALACASVSTPPPGFGAEAELFTIQITEEDRREAERSFRYYDRNQDGKIDAEEMSRSRYGFGFADVRPES